MINERIRVNTYWAKKKENQSEAKKLPKRDLKNRDTDFKKKEAKVNVR